MTTQLRILTGLRSQAAIALTLILTLTLNLQAQSTDTKPRTVTVKKGRVLELSLVKSLTSRNAKIGDDVVLRLTRPLMADGATVLPAKWLVHGRITDVKRAGKNCKPGLIRWELKTLTMTDGKTVEIQSLPDDVARANLRDQAAQDTLAAQAGGKTSAKSPGKTGTSAAGIAEDVIGIPLVILMLSAAVRSDIRGSARDESCHGSTGREDSIRAGTPFFAEIANDVQQVVD